MPSIVKKANNAHLRRELFLEVYLKSKFTAMYVIWQMWHNKDYKTLGFENFKMYCEAPIDSGGLNISRAWAIELAETYQKYAVELNVAEQQLLDLSPRKLYKIRNLVNKENVADWLSKVKFLSLEDLDLEIKGIDIVKCEHLEFEEYKKCKNCKHWWRIKDN